MLYGHIFEARKVSAQFLMDLAIGIENRIESSHQLVVDVSRSILVIQTRNFVVAAEIIVSNLEFEDYVLVEVTPNAGEEQLGLGVDLAWLRLHEPLLVVQSSTQVNW